MAAKYLIVNADDLGLCVSTNIAVERAYREGQVTSVSLMAGMPALDDAAERLARAKPRPGLGIHLCLTSGRSVLPPAEVSLLVDSSGAFRHGFFGLAALLRSSWRREALAQIAAEFHAQAARIDALGMPVDHVDSHQHIHMLPDLFSLAVEEAHSRGAAIRISDERFRPSHGWPHHLARLSLDGGVLKKILLSHLAGNSRKEARGIYATDGYFGVLESGRMTVALLLDILDALPSGVSEVNMHPGMVTGKEPLSSCSRADQKFVRSPRRTAELEAVTHRALADRLSRLGIVTTTFGEAASLAGMPAGYPPNVVEVDDGSFAKSMAGGGYSG